MTPLIQWTEKGLYCAAGDFYIDPSRGVDTAVITHAHSDHARRGSRRYFCASTSVKLLKSRLGARIQVQGVPYSERFKLGEVEVSFHPAGHILGSAQIRVQRGSEVWVASGDYKRDPDPSCEPFEVVACDTFITEATFGTPKYSWGKNPDHGRDIHQWWMKNASEGRNSLLFGYSLGKAQRILAELAPHAQTPVLIHSTIAELTQCYREEGRNLAPTVELDFYRSQLANSAKTLRGELILAPPSILKSEWLEHLGDFQTAFASGWMQGSQGSLGYRGSYDHGFVMSDHADWESLNRTIDETGAKRVFVQHRNGALIRHLRQRGVEAYPESELAPDNDRWLEPANLSLFDLAGKL
jgi:putative mRNA 3-end processing factor